MVTYGKLAKAELSTGGLIVQTGTVAFAATGTTSAAITTPLSYVLGVSFTRIGKAVASGTPCLKNTAGTPAHVLTLVAKANCSASTWAYTLIGY